MEILRFKEKNATDKLAAIEDQSVDDRKDGQLVDLESRSAKDLLDPSSRGVFLNWNALLDYTVSVCMETPSEPIMKFDANATNFLEWITQAENSTTSSRLLSETKEVPNLYNASS